MTDTTLQKVHGPDSPKGEMGQTYLVSGKRMSMRMWEGEPADKRKTPTVRDYETIGYVIAGKAQLEIEGQIMLLERGDSWLVPAGARHMYKILEPFTAVEATAPPSQVHGRDMPPAEDWPERL